MMRLLRSMGLTKAAATIEKRCGSASSAPALRGKEAGFSLIELSIVLVIIGLLVGGVLLQQDMMRGAQVRAQISQFSQYSTAVYTFRERYKGLPGDTNSASRYFLMDEWADVRDGNGNGKIEVATSALTNGLADVNNATYADVDTLATPLMGGETLQFWHHLSAAGMISGYYHGKAASGEVNEYNESLDPRSEHRGEEGYAFPSAKLGGNGIGVYTSERRLYFQLGVLSGYEFRVDPSLTPQEAHNIDMKLDDGRPLSGSVSLRGSQKGAVVNTPLTESDFGASLGVTTACIEEDSSIASTPNSARYGQTNVARTCSVRFRVN